MTQEKRYWHLVAGFNYRLTNLQAAIGFAQLEKIDDFLSYREEVVNRYANQLKDIDGVILPPQKEWAKNIYWLYSILVDNEATGIHRDTLIGHLSVHGIDTRPLFYPLHQQPPFADEKGNRFPNAEWLSAYGLSLPTSNNIKLEDVDKVCAVIRSVLKNKNIFRKYDIG
jgi:perosamine synthetase